MIAEFPLCANGMPDNRYSGVGDFAADARSVGRNDKPQ
jgi:hypothetical protein